MSSHVEPRISLSAVVRKCQVRAAKPGASMGAAPVLSIADDSGYVCMYFYDVDNMGLRALTGAESSVLL